jgi:hypothetical protein
MAHFLSTLRNTAQPYRAYPPGEGGYGFFWEEFNMQYFLVRDPLMPIHAVYFIFTENYVPD